MRKHSIVIDSTVYIPQEMIQENNIGVASLNVIADGVSYREVEVDNQFIFDMQDKGHSFTTSQPAPGEFYELFEKAVAETEEKVFYVGLSKGVSGTLQSAMLARKMLDNPDKVHLFDTELCAYGSEMIAIELVEMVRANKSTDEIINRIEAIIKTSHQMFTVENLFSLTKGGRLSLARAAIGTVLRVKPIIGVVEGRLELVKSERTYKKVHQYFIDNIKKTTEGYDKITFYITNQNSLDSGNQVREELETAFPGSKITFTSYLGPVFSIHVGRKGYGISWFAE